MRTAVTEHEGEATGPKVAPSGPPLGWSLLDGLAACDPRGVLELQRSAGNRAVAAALISGDRRRRSLSRVIEETDAGALAGSPRLTSPRFSDQARLQACFADRARLTMGAQDSVDDHSVSAVQQALIDLGYHLGPSGADGIYGNLTWNAVKAFKQDQTLGWESMGDVGPGTMRRLDTLFPEEGRPPCDLDEVLDEASPQAAVSASPSLVVARSMRTLARAPAAGVTAPPGAVAASGGHSAVGTPGDGVVEIPFKGSVAESLFNIARWMHAPGQSVDENRAAAAVQKVLSDPDTQLNVTDDPVFCHNKAGWCPVPLHAYEEWARLKGKTKMRVGPGPIKTLCDELGVSPQAASAAAKDEEQFGKTLDAAQDWLFFGQPSVPHDPEQADADSRKAREKRMPVNRDDAVLENPQYAKLYVTMMKAKVGLGVDESTLTPDNGLSTKNVSDIIAGNATRRYLTDLFEQGLKEYRDAGGTDVAGGYVILEASLWDQVLWGNPTAIRNELMIGIGKPERQLGLVYKYDGILYYNEQGEPMTSFSGTGYRDPGFKGTAKDPGFINLDWIADPELRGFLKLLHDTFKTPTMIIAKGAEAYAENFDDVNDLIRSGLADEIKDELEDAIKVMIGFLLYRAASMALMRQPHPWLKAIGAGMEVTAEAAGYLLQIEFIGSTEDKLVRAGYHLAKVVPRDKDGNMDDLSRMEMTIAADRIRPMVAEIATMIIMAVGERVAKGPKPKAKAEFEAITKNGKRMRLKCTFCELVEVAAEFTQSVFKEIYETTRAETGAAEGEVLHHPDYKSVELHPDGSMYGDHGELTKLLNKYKWSGKRSGHRATFESHHLMENHQMERFGVPENKGRAVALDSDDHKVFSAWMRGLLDRRTVMDVDELYTLSRDMYQMNGHPEFIDEMDIFMRKWKDVIRDRYASGQKDIPGVRRADFPQRRDRVLKFLDDF